MSKLEPIYTEKTQCQDCYKCVRECPVKAIKVVDGSAIVIPKACILCGHCTQVCPVHAKKIRDDLDEAKAMLASGARVYASLAPSYRTEFSGLKTGVPLRHFYGLFIGSELILFEPRSEYNSATPLRARYPFSLII